MVWRIVFVLLVVLGADRAASANGRYPGTSSITFRTAHEDDIIVGLTFGLVLSHDGGRTWSWMCEDAVGYTGMYDPRYSYNSSGSLFATTYDGLKAVRDGCTFSPLPSGKTFTSSIAEGPDHTFYYAAAQTAGTALEVPADFKIYRSSDDGLSFTPSTPAGANDVNDWWATLMVAPSNKLRVYATGYSYNPPANGGETVRGHLLFRSDDGGVSWVAMTTTGLTLAANSTVEIVGIASDVPDHVYARVKLDDNTVSDSLNRSLDGGMTWHQIKHLNGPITSFVVRRGRNTSDTYDLIYGTQTLGAELSHDDGETWTPLVNPPHMRCLVENTARELWACSQNFSDQNVASDGAGVMKTTDLVTWTRVLRYQDLTEAVACPAGTAQQTKCAPMWCAVCEQLGCKPSATYGCPVATEAPPEAPPARRTGGCCEAGPGGGAGPLALALSVGTVMLRPRRRRAIR